MPTKDQIIQWFLDLPGTIVSGFEWIWEQIVDILLILALIVVIIMGISATLQRDEDGCPLGYALSRTEQVCIKGYKPEKVDR